MFSKAFVISNTVESKATVITGTVESKATAVADSVESRLEWRPRHSGVKGIVFYDPN